MIGSSIKRVKPVLLPMLLLSMTAYIAVHAQESNESTELQIEYSALARRVKKAHEQSELGVHWLAYGNAVGGTSGEILYVVPFGRFAEIDAWPLEGDVLRDAFGEAEAARIERAITAITRTETQIWKLLPTMSHFPD